MESAKMESAKPASQPDSDRRFWSEMYWFLVIALGAWLIAGWVLPERLAGTLNLLDHEKKLSREIKALAHKKVVLENAIESMENDPIYQEGVYRNRLGFKRSTEEYIEPAPPLFR